MEKLNENLDAFALRFCGGHFCEQIILFIFAQ
jgi:hypothetical protein